MVATAWDIQLGHEFGEPFTIHGIGAAPGGSMASHGIVDRLRADLAALLSSRKEAIVEAIYDRAGFASAHQVKIRPDNLAARFVERVVEGLRGDDFAALMDWVRELHQLADRRMLAEIDIPRMLDAGCALAISAAASIRDEITDIALFFAELRQELQGAYVRSAIRAAGRAKPAAPPARAPRSDGAPLDHLAAEIARELGLHERSCSFMEHFDRLRAAGIPGVPAELLGDETPLTRPELELVAGHAAFGAQSLARLEAWRAFATVELLRDERWETRAEHIPLASRIIAVVDAYAEMLATHRSPQRALAALEDEAGKRWDPVVVAAAVRLLRE
ncbi:hypothetical protein EPN42_10770 [bacterium]|nr:MAG: hypothetical protein EPN42_10770 [bacterium]